MGDIDHDHSDAGPRLVLMRPMELGYRGTELRRKLVAAVLRGEKIATASLREEYVPKRTSSYPNPARAFSCSGTTTTHWEW
jgi:hypothetical protein